MKLVKFNTAGRWADPDTNIPQIEVKEGDEVEVSDALADLVVSNNRGEVVDTTDKEAADKEAADKEAADKEAKVDKKTPATKDKAKAESK